MGREPTFFNVSKNVSFHDGGIHGVDAGAFPKTFLFYLTKKGFKKDILNRYVQFVNNLMEEI